MASFRIPIPMSVTVMQMPLFNPLKHRRLVTVTGRSVHHRRNSITPLRCSPLPIPGNDNAVIILHVGGMMCEGCANNVKRILESRPQVSSANVNLTSEVAIVSPVSEEKLAPNWKKQLGEALAQHLTTCGFTSTLQGIVSIFPMYFFLRKSSLCSQKLVVSYTIPNIQNS
ncbi:hypothetical protein RJT34_13416 [Clitoria ternatea]|uniref:HMA domain-containing protein n=1 Tax=Clitoria ternatea TaxID=43366 RepID=A0AAN9PLS7_CLITE